MFIMLFFINSDKDEGTLSKMLKVFGIGFHKTGTTSLDNALSQVGYRVTGPNGVNDANIKQSMIQMCTDIVPKYDAFLDNPWPLLYQRLDGMYPKSQFVLTLRPTDEWIGSIVNHFGSEKTEMRKMIYGVGCPKGNEAVYIDRYEQHNKDVLTYFENRPDDLLVLKVSEGEGWEKLSPFLGVDVIGNAFPHENKASNR